MSGSYHSLFTITCLIVIMTLEFETTHEYYLRDANIYYCSEHEALIVTRDHEDRLLINGISKSTMLKFAAKLYKESLKTELSKDKDSESKDEKPQPDEKPAPEDSDSKEQPATDTAKDDPA